MKDRNINIVNPKEKMIEPFKKIRVCAYVRVSTVNEKQQYSLKNQTEYFQDKLDKNPDYVNCGVYSDSGVSGNKTERPGLNELMREAREGKIDLVLTKSISRFARNTVMLLNIIRELKELNVAVIFEEQNINTLSAEGELMITVLGAFAEEERKAVSKNIKWAVQKRYQQGKGMVDTNRLLGYDKDKNRNLIINEEQAEIVRKIYEMFLKNISGNKIASILNKENIPTYTNNPWASHRILSIISNEKYKGDFLMQKTFVSHTGKQIINRGEKPKYYLENSHPPIISTKDWEAAQIIREKRKTKIYPYTGKIKCPYCKASLIRMVHQKKWVSWICATYLQKGKDACKGARIRESLLKEIYNDREISNDKDKEIYNNKEIYKDKEIFKDKEIMVLLEVNSEKRTQARTKEDYSLVPYEKYFKG